MVLNASGLSLFGFTHLYVALNGWMGLDGSGLGWFSLFVAICAVVYAVLDLVVLDDLAFGIIWLHWAGLWTLFFLLLGLGRTELTRFTGLVAATQGWATAAIPSFLLLTGRWAQVNTAVAVALVAPA